MTHYAIAITTIGSEEEGRRLARALVEARLAACVSIIPDVLSVYNWKAELQEEREWLLLMKTRADKAPGIRALFAASHPYEVPEFVVIPIAEGAGAYLEWIGAWLGPPARRRDGTQGAGPARKPRAAKQRSKAQKTGASRRKSRPAAGRR